MDALALALTPHTRTDDLLEWCAAQGREVAERPLRTVLTLLELSGTPVHDGFPEPTAADLDQLLHEQLPMTADTEPDGDQAYLDAVAAIIDHQRAAKRLNAKRQARLHEELAGFGDGFRLAMRMPGRLTWPRLYAMLLRRDGVDGSDQAAVRAWLDAFRQRDADQRAAAWADLPQLITPEEEHGRPEAWGHTRLLTLGMATENARLFLGNRLLERVYRSLTAMVAEGRGLPPELGRDVEGYGRLVAEEAARLLGEWTVPGLPALLRADYPDLAPEPDPAEIPR
ncbi:hypothetical protein [Peterkaempfera bronchialis]|uniref:Uncharacterized protein n=1 Tax=Peterkaempfera bronchialis TaxID=2126346 RepID=A0A345SXA3_9ACTN|nr:hypothetical protein [Peterkaempfera bronchialis]AXI78358.1 hypothetical protein C7M71_013840 [Peterkaempfera bronchialis]